MLAITTTIATSLVALGLTAAQPADQPQRIAVYDFTADGIDERTARIVSEATVTELRKRKGVLVVSMSEIRAMIALETDKQFMECSDDSCLAEIGDALGVDGLVVGQLSRLAGGSVFLLRRIDQRAAKVLGSVNKRLDEAGGEEFLAAVGDSVEELFSEYPLRKGQERGVDPQIALRVNPPPLAPWIFWSSVGASGVAMGTGAALGAATVVSRVVLTRYVSQEVIDGAEVVQKQRTAAGLGWSTTSAAVLAVALGGAAAILVPFTDFAGYGSEGGE